MTVGLGVLVAPLSFLRLSLRLAVFACGAGWLCFAKPDWLATTARDAPTGKSPAAKASESATGCALRATLPIRLGRLPHRHVCNVVGG